MIYKSLVKAVVFCLGVAMFIVLVKLSAGSMAKNYSEDWSDSSADTSFFFVGSSRVQLSIDPEIIGSYYGHDRVYNLGLSGGTFLSHCIMADFVIRRPGYKVVFIEISPFVADLPESIFTFSVATGHDPLATARAITESQPRLEHYRLILSIINQQVYNSISLRKNVKQLIKYRVSEETEWIGFHPSTGNDPSAMSSFLRWEEIAGKSHTNAIDVINYSSAISYLENLARSNHAKVVFFLPVTYAKQVEKNIVIPVFSSLPDSSKLKYDESFLKEIRNKDYLMDPYHLNARGAGVYSTMLVRAIEEHVSK